MSSQLPAPVGSSTFERIKCVNADPLDYAIFMDHGYRELYGVPGMHDIRERKRLKPRQQVLDHMGSTELAANLFRATQTEEKLRRENVRSLKIAAANVSSL